MTLSSSLEAKLTYLYAHGIADDKNQAYLYTKTNPSNPTHMIDNENHDLLTFNFPDAGQGIIYPKINTWTDLFKVAQHIRKMSYKVDRAHTSFAQENEIKALNDAHATIDTDVIGFGVSRGASTFITWLGSANEAKHNIKALILESPFDSMDSVLRNMLGEKLYNNPRTRRWGHSLISFVFSQYKKDGITPLGVAANIPKELPILIVCSQEDSRVPVSSSKKLYDELVATGHTNVHFVMLDRGDHGKLSKNERYCHATHAFYQRYDLPHNPAFAKLGRTLI